MERPFALGDRLGRLVGAAAGQAFIGDSTTVLLYKLVRAAVDHQVAQDPERTEIVIDDDNFPTDRFVVEGVAAERGLTVRWIEADPAAGVALEQVREAVGERTALVVLSHVAYRSGFVADVPAITAAVHEAGALVLWDLCHSTGVIPTELDAWGADLAVGCTYKYLNGGPGSPAFGYVAERLQGELAQPIQGWMGAADVFSMERHYRAAPDLRRFLSGTPPVLATVALEAMVELIEHVGIPAIHEKSIALTGFAEAALAEHVLPLEVGGRRPVLASPPAGPHRGSHLTVTHPSFREVNAAAVATGRHRRLPRARRHPHRPLAAVDDLRRGRGRHRRARPPARAVGAPGLVMPLGLGSRRGEISRTDPRRPRGPPRQWSQP